MFYHLTPVSSNQKVGPIPVSTTSAKTCPPSCPLNNKQGCYAESGPLALHWRKVTDEQRGTNFNQFLELIRALPKGQLWRYAQAGDLPGSGDVIDREQLRLLAKAASHTHVIAYSHKPPVGDNLDGLREAEQLGFRINLSADDLDEADAFVDLGFHTVVTLPEAYGRSTRGKDWGEDINQYRERLDTLERTTPRGRSIVVCPATYLDTNCSKCRLCAVKPNKDQIIGFPAHGVGKGKITNAPRLASLRN